MNLFLVTSGIHGPYGIYDVKTRIEQTLHTAKTVKEFCSNSELILMEGGAESLSDQELSLLETVYDRVIQYTSDHIVQFAHRVHKDEVISLKGPLESYMLAETCKQLCQSNASYDRIFKLSGRYYLTDEFDFSKHLSISGKYLFKQRDPGQSYGKLIPDTPFQYKTRLYSFCGSLLNQAAENYQKIFDSIVASYSRGTFIDIEHSTFKAINPNLIAQTNPIGVAGYMASGEFVKE